jgi:N-carbamoylputrescine amidase
MDENSKLNIALIQQVCAGDKAAIITKSIAHVRKAAASGAKIICLPELFANRYFCSEEKIENFDLAEKPDSEIIESFGELAAELKVVLIYPFFEERAPGLCHNSAIVFDANGEVLDIYRKMHIPHDPLFYEKYYFTPGEKEDGYGEHGFKIFDTLYGKIGVLICWDQWFPEAARIVALMGAEVIFYPTAIGWHPKEKASFGEAQVDAWKTMQRSHAIANGVFIAASNRVGFEPTPNTDGIEFFGNSFIADPFGRVLAEADRSSEQILNVSLDRKLIQETRRNWPFLRDRRIDAYSNILQRWSGY